MKRAVGNHRFTIEEGEVDLQQCPEPSCPWQNVKSSNNGMIGVEQWRKLDDNLQIYWWMEIWSAKPLGLGKKIMIIEKVGSWYPENKQERMRVMKCTYVAHGELSNYWCWQYFGPDYDILGRALARKGMSRPSITLLAMVPYSLKAKSQTWDTGTGQKN
jgi:hypothetical protein